MWQLKVCYRGLKDIDIEKNGTKFPNFFDFLLSTLESFEYY